MKKSILIIMALLFVGCGTVDCTKCPTVTKTKILTPTMACYRPPSLEDLKKELVSTKDVMSEGKLIEVIAINVKTMERHIKLWEGYRNCVEKTLKAYENIKTKMVDEKPDKKEE